MFPKNKSLYAHISTGESSTAFWIISCLILCSATFHSPFNSHGNPEWVKLSLQMVYTHRRTFLFWNPVEHRILVWKEMFEMENIVFYKWKIYVIICNPRASSETAEHRLECISAEADFSKRGANDIYDEGNVVHKFTALPWIFRQLKLSYLWRCCFSPSPRLYSLSKSISVDTVDTVDFQNGFI